MPLLPGFKKLFPGIYPVPLVASVLFFTPIIRDFVSWCGVRQVGFLGSHTAAHHQRECDTHLVYVKVFRHLCRVHVHT